MQKIGQSMLPIGMGYLVLNDYIFAINQSMNTGSRHPPHPSAVSAGSGDCADIL